MGRYGRLLDVTRELDDGWREFQGSNHHSAAPARSRSYIVVPALIGTTHESQQQGKWDFAGP